MTKSEYFLLENQQLKKFSTGAGVAKKTHKFSNGILVANKTHGWQIKRTCGKKKRGKKNAPPCSSLYTTPYQRELVLRNNTFSNTYRGVRFICLSFFCHMCVLFATHSFYLPPKSRLKIYVFFLPP